MNQLLQETINEIRGMTEAELIQRIADMKAEIIRLQDVIEERNMIGEFLPTSADCAFCDVNIATTHTTCDDFVCQSCRDEFEDALNSGDTE